MIADEMCYLMISHCLRHPHRRSLFPAAAERGGDTCVGKSKLTYFLFLRSIEGEESSSLARQTCSSALTTRSSFDQPILKSNKLLLYIHHWRAGGRELSSPSIGNLTEQADGRGIKLGFACYPHLIDYSIERILSSLSLCACNGEACNDWSIFSHRRRRRRCCSYWRTA